MYELGLNIIRFISIFIDFCAVKVMEFLMKIRDYNKLRGLKRYLERFGWLERSGWQECFGCLGVIAVMLLWKASTGKQFYMVIYIFKKIYIYI